MTDILHDSGVDEAERERAERAARIAEAMGQIDQSSVNVAIAMMPGIIDEYAPSLPSSHPDYLPYKIFKHLPADKDEVLAMADRFDQVAEYAKEHPRYLGKILFGKVGDFALLHAEIEATAQAIDPTRANLRQP